MVKAVTIIRESQKGAENIPYFYSPEHFLVNAFMEAVTRYSKKLGGIKIAISVLSAYIVSESKNGNEKDKSKKTLSDPVIK